MKTFKQWLEGIVPGQKSPAVAAVESQAKVAVQNAVKTGTDPVQAAKNVTARAVAGGILPIPDLAKVMPSGVDVNPTTKKMKKK